MGLCWKRAWDGTGTREDAERQAARNCNVVAVPLELFECLNEYQCRTAAAERKLAELGIQ